MFIVVRQLSQRLKKEDVFSLPAGPYGKGSVKTYVVPVAYTQTEERALDWFHRVVPISVLDDFEISVSR